VNAQIPIPNRYDGFGLGDPQAPIMFEAFFDLLCPDCAGAWPNIKDVISYYNPPSKSQLYFILHTFPLPYHHNAFYASQGVHVVNAIAPNLLWKYVDSMFTNQASFWDDATSGSTPDNVKLSMASLVESTVGINHGQFLNGLSNDTLNMDTRISWKYGCSRGVAWTPAFFVNGISVVADPSWTLSDWRIILDPLVSGERVSRHSHGAFDKCSLSVKNHRAAHPLQDTVGDCPAGQFACTYKPGKTQCCLNGEHCIPNVGCRC
jgi:hypothetical protein